MENHITSIQNVLRLVPNTDDLAVDDFKRILDASKYYHSNQNRPRAQELRNKLKQICRMYAGIVPKMHHFLPNVLITYNRGDILVFETICQREPSRRTIVPFLDLSEDTLSRRPPSRRSSSSGRRSSGRSSSRQTFTIGGTRKRYVIKSKRKRRYTK